MTPEEMVDELRATGRRAEGFNSIQVWEKVAELLYEGFTDNFARAADADGNPWPPRKSKKRANPLLILTSLLIRSVGGQAASIFDAKPFELAVGVVGTEVPYAAIHNEGGRVMPQREYLNVTGEVEDKATEVFLAAYTEHFFKP
jgi:phage gpG-like protein